MTADQDPVREEISALLKASRDRFFDKQEDSIATRLHRHLDQASTPVTFSPEEAQRRSDEVMQTISEKLHRAAAILKAAAEKP